MDLMVRARPFARRASRLLAAAVGAHLSTTRCITPRALYAALSILPWALGLSPGPSNGWRILCLRPTRRHQHDDADEDDHSVNDPCRGHVQQILGERETHHEDD